MLALALAAVNAQERHASAAPRTLASNGLAPAVRLGSPGVWLVPGPRLASPTARP